MNAFSVENATDLFRVLLQSLMQDIKASSLPEGALFGSIRKRMQMDWIFAVKVTGLPYRLAISSSTIFLRKMVPLREFCEAILGAGEG